MTLVAYGIAMPASRGVLSTPSQDFPSLGGLGPFWDFSDASTVTTATGISQVNDKSSYGLALTQATGANQPAYATAAVNGKNVARFDGVNDYIGSAAAKVLDGLAGFAVHAVVANLGNPQAGTNYYDQYTLLIDRLYTYLGFHRDANKSPIAALQRSSFSNCTCYKNSIATGSPCVVSWVFDGSQATDAARAGVYLNGVQVTGLTFDAAVPASIYNDASNTGFYLGSEPSPPTYTNPFAGDLGILAIQRQAPSAGEIAAAYAFARANWGVP